ncbi:hypothetical protein [Natronomonas sp. EA1]|uniref:hypothetical protein n=1 Tax=Natronomonas sp. EA1 TaxID=3421655 RepID=UPI003EC00C89
MAPTLWLLDRATALIAYGALFLATLTGILYSPRTATKFGIAHRAALTVHVPIAVFALLMMLVHGVLGSIDTWKVYTGASPAPTFGTTYLLVGVAVGIIALGLVIVAALGFLDPRRFSRPWTPRLVHALAYAGFGFATVHVVAVGTDVTGYVRAAVFAAAAFVAYVLVLKLLVNKGYPEPSRS